MRAYFAYVRSFALYQMLANDLILALIASSGGCTVIMCSLAIWWNASPINQVYLVIHKTLYGWYPVYVLETGDVISAKPVVCNLHLLWYVLSVSQLDGMISNWESASIMDMEWRYMLHTRKYTGRKILMHCNYKIPLLVSEVLHLSYADCMFLILRWNKLACLRKTI